MKQLSKVLSLILAVVLLASVAVACGDKKDDAKSGDKSGGSAATSDVLTGTWKQTDEVNGDWEWTFDGAGKCKLVGITTGFESEGTYKLDEGAKTVSVDMESWDNVKVYAYTLEGDNLDLNSDYSNYHLVKE